LGRVAQIYPLLQNLATIGTPFGKRQFGGRYAPKLENHKKAGT